MAIVPYNTYCNFRVFDLEKSIEFYTNVMDMQVIHRMDHEEFQFTIVFLGYGPKESDICLELTYNWDKRSYEHGGYFGQLVISVPDVYKAVEEVEKKGAKVTRPAAPLKGTDLVIAFIEDVDGYLIEFVPELH